MASSAAVKLHFAWWWACVVAKIGFASSLVIGILVAYGMKFSVTSAGPFTLGLYGVVILADFIVQTSCAYFNRVKTERLAKQGEKAGIAALDIIIAVVGYREDSDAWKKCLHSLQKQDAPPRVIVGVVDGQDGPDQSMAQDFAACFPPETTLIADLPELLSKEYTTVYWENMPAPPPKTIKSRLASWKRSIANLRTEDELRAERIAWAAIEARWKEWDAEHDFNKYKAVCLTQPHGHKRTAMFTAFTLAMLVYKAQDAVFTTDSDTILDPAALRQMSYVLGSDPDIGGVTGDVKIWNKKESWLALMCALRYWFAFNIERACQSYYRCVTCISGPIGLYRVTDMRTILGPWVLQTFLGRDCTFGDDRHLTNRLLGEGRKTAYTHLAFCESDSPAGFVRWVKQQTRWSKSFFREAFWFPSAFAKHSVWLSIETFKQTLYPFILVSTIFQFLYAPTTLLRPVFWLATMFGVAAIKSTYAWIITGDATMMLFSLYGVFYFFGLLPSKIFALLTINITAWGTSARSTAERKKRESFTARHWHVCHLLVWFWAIGGGFMVFFHHHFRNPLLWSLPVAGPLVAATIVPYWDLIQYDLKFYWTSAVTKIRGTASGTTVEGTKAEVSEKTHGTVSMDASITEKSSLPNLVVAPIGNTASVSPTTTPSRSASSSSFLSTLSDRSARADVGVVDPFADNYAVADVKTRESSIPFPLATHQKSPSNSRRSSAHNSEEELFGYFAEAGAGLPLPVTTPPATPKRRSSRAELAHQASREILRMPSLFNRDSDATAVSIPAPTRRSSADAGLPSNFLDVQVDGTTLGRRSSAGSLRGPSEGDVYSRPSTPGSLGESGLFIRKDSMDRRPSASARRKSSIAHVQSWRGKDSAATLFSGGTWRPSMTERSSTSTLVDMPVSPVGTKLSAAHSRFNPAGFKNPFAKYDPNESEELNIQVVGQQQSHDPKSLAGLKQHSPSKLAGTYRGQPHAGNLSKLGAEPPVFQRPFADLASANSRIV